MKCPPFIILCWFLLFYGTAPAAPVVQPFTNRWAFDVETQFSALEYQGDPLSFHRGSVADPTPWVCKHYGGVVRDPRPGFPYVYIGRSGVHSGSCEGQPDEPAEFIVIKLGSRNTDGELFRSNRLKRLSDQADTQPIAQDRAVASVHLDGQNSWPHYGHLGGMQFIGDHIIALPLDNALSTNWSKGGVCFVDVTNPESPQPLLTTPGAAGRSTGLIAMDVDPASNKYLLLFSRFTSRGLILLAGNSLSNLTWETEWDVDTDQPGLDSIWEQWQSIQFVRQDANTLYLVAMDNQTTIITDEHRDVVALFKFTYTNLTTTNQSFSLEFINKRTFFSGGPDMGDMDASACTYVSPTGELLMYTTEHIDGPESPGDTVRMGEWRSKNMFNRHPQQPCTSWVTLYEDVSGETGARLTIDYQDYLLENYNDLSQMLINGVNWASRARAVRWYAPPGATIRLRNNAADADLARYLDLAGDGTVQFISNLADVSWTSGGLGNPSRNVRGVQFLAESGAPVVYVPDFADSYSSALPFLNLFPGCRTLSFAEGDYYGHTSLGIAGKPFSIRARGGTVSLRR